MVKIYGRLWDSVGKVSESRVCETKTTTDQVKSPLLSSPLHSPSLGGLLAMNLEELHGESR
jgi:hypothetical protein